MLVTIPLSDSSRKILAIYKKSRSIKSTNDVVEAFVQEFGKDISLPPMPDPSPVPTPTPTPTPVPTTKHDVDIYHINGKVVADSGNKRLATILANNDASALFKLAVDSVPNGGSLGIGEGRYMMSAPYEFALDPNGKNIFYSSIQIFDKSAHIYGAGIGKTILELMPWQNSSSRHVAMVLIRGTEPFALGYSSFSIDGITFDGNSANQYSVKEPYDGVALVLVGSERSNGKYTNLEFVNSPGAGLYLGNNGSGFGSNELVQFITSRNCAGAGVMLDTNYKSRVLDCRSSSCREGLYLNGNNDFKTRHKDCVVAKRIETDSQITIWQVNDFLLDDVHMNGVGSKTSYGLVIRDGFGEVVNSVLSTDRMRIDARGGPGCTYIYEGSEVVFSKCVLNGYLGIHAIGKSHVIVQDSRLDCPGACFCTTDPNPVTSHMVSLRNDCTGPKTNLQGGSTFTED